MSASFLLRARWLMWCSTSTSVMVRSGQPAAAMQRIAQREKAFHATISPNSNSDSSMLRSETRCDDETMPRRARPAFAGAAFEGAAPFAEAARTVAERDGAGADEGLRGVRAAMELQILYR